jgi:hypothetical protein
LLSLSRFSDHGGGLCSLKMAGPLQTLGLDIGGAPDGANQIYDRFPRPTIRDNVDGV